jgi:NADH-quinone oxidoreductase subunit N
MNVSFGELLRALLPETALVLGALLVLAVDLTVARKQSLERRLKIAASLAFVAVILALAAALRIGLRGPAFGAGFMLDSLGLAARVGVLVLTGLTLEVMRSTTRTRHPAEFVAIILFATCGFTLMAVAQQLLVAFLALELASLSLYLLAGFDKSRPEFAEAAVKYFLFGGMSAAFLLFGFSLLYGLTGTIDLREIAEHLATQRMSPLHLVALVMVLVAFGFKAAAAPFHLWAPDVYQGAPTPSAALIASGSKLAGFVLFTRLLCSGLMPVAGSALSVRAGPGWLPVVAFLSVLSLLVGNLGALAQTNVRRLLAYSAIAHAGAMLLGVMAAGRSGPAPLFYYAGTYGLATVGAFGVLAVVERAGVGPRIADLAGLHRRSPLLTTCLLVFMLSLAGIPPLAGFFGKFAVFAAALQLGGASSLAGMLVILAILLSAVGLYYYLIVLKQALVAAPASSATTIPVPARAGLTLVAIALALLLLGLFPSLVLRLFA